MSYREKIYERYATRFQDAKAVFDLEAARRWGRAYRHYLKGWTPPDKSSPLLDVACGWGRLLQLYKDLGYSDVTGVDLSPEQAAIAAQVGVSIHNQNAIEFLRANGGRFQFISGLDIVEHFTKDEVLEFLDACLNALRPGGRLVLQTPNADSPWGTTHRYNDFTHEVGFNPNSLGRIMKLVGFQNPQFREQGPIGFGYSPASSIRWLGWQAIRAGLVGWNYCEIGHPGSRIFSRIFLASAIR